MKLYYRGVSYEYDPSQVTSRKTGRPFQRVNRSGDAYNLIYRGSIYRVDPNAKPTEVLAPQVAYQLIYRGISYSVNKTAQGYMTVTSQPANTAKKAHGKWDFWLVK